MSFVFREEKGEELTYKEVDDNNRFALSIVNAALTAISQVAGFMKVIKGVDGAIIDETVIGNCVVMDFATDNFLIIPKNLDVDLPVGVILNVRRMGTGITTITPADGVSLVSSTGTFSINTYGSASLHKTEVDTWVLEGNLL